jgi:hypothetical protein
MPCRFCGDSGSYATNEIGRWDRLFDVSDPITWPRFIGAFSCQFLDVDRNESGRATCRQVDLVSLDGRPGRPETPAVQVALRATGTTW